MPRSRKAKAVVVAKPQAPPAPLPKPSNVEREAIAVARERHNGRRVRVQSGLVNRDGALVLTNPHSDGGGWEIRLRNAMGTRSVDFLDANIKYMASLFRTSDGGVNVTEVDAVLAVLDGAEPQNEIEAMLVIQMAITHVLAMRSARNLAGSKEIPQQDSNGLSLHRLTRTFTSQIDALSKLKRGGSQKVTVEHVHVYPGGQAIVGNVTQSPGAGGVLEIAGQPLAANDPRALALAACAPMLCQDTEREALPVTDRARQEALPDARRGTGLGSTEGRTQRDVPARSLHGRSDVRTGNEPKMDARGPSVCRQPLAMSGERN